MASDFLKKILPFTGVAGALGLFNREDPAAEAAPYYGGMPFVGEKYLGPYTDRGEQAYDALMPLYEQLANDPQALLGQIMSDYQASPAYRSQLDLMMGDLQNEAAAGGYLGTDRDARQRLELAQKLASQDYWKYADNVLGQQERGLAGLSDIGKLGFGAASERSDIGIQSLDQTGQAAAYGASQKNKNKNDLMRAMLEAAFGGFGSSANKAGRGGF